MKKQIPTLIIGILIGAILSTSVLLIVKNNTSSNMPNFKNGNNSSEVRPSDSNFDPNSSSETQTTTTATEEN